MENEHQTVEKTPQKITKDMIISEILERYPQKASQLTEIMAQAGLHCFGCGASAFETLEQGVLGHGYSEEDLELLVNDLNAAVEQDQNATAQPDSFMFTLTSAAANKAKSTMEQEKRVGHGMRIAVLAGGCSGFSYHLSLSEKPLETDMVLEQEGVKLFIDSESIMYLNGVVLDYVDTLNESGFKFTNPNAHGTCGCGKSFK